jgi:superfamily II DNA or RNA helicase
LCSDGYVYNLEVDQYHTYTANGLIVHNCHHATAPTYRNVINHFRKNPKLKVLGVTATPDRSDEEALGKVFESVAFEYDIVNGIHDGWLVPIETHCVTVDGLDLSSVRTTAGDLNGADLAEVMEYEENLHKIAHPTLELTKGRKTLVFAASVAHAERLAEIFNRHEAGCANWVCGETPKEDRRRMFADFAARRFRMLVNVGVATEGFDDPGIEVVAIARPTKSRALYAQMIGRGTRPLPWVVEMKPLPKGAMLESLSLFEMGIDRDKWEEKNKWLKIPENRLAAIAASGKPRLEILDFVGNSGRHKLVTAADVLGGNVTDDVIDRAKKMVADAAKPMNMLDALEEAEEELRKEREAERAKEMASRANLRLKAKYAATPVDAFDIFEIAPRREQGWDKGRQVSEKMRNVLESNGIDCEGVNYTQAQQLIGEIFDRRERGLCSLKQAKHLKRHGYSADTTFAEAKVILDGIFGNRGGAKGDLMKAAEAAGIKRY